MSCLFFFSLFFLPIAMSMLGSCPLWTSFEQVTWGILVYPNKGSLGHLLQHENSSTGLNKRRLINLKVDSCKSTYLSLGLSFLLPTGICLSMFFFKLLSAHLSTIYLHYSTVLVIPLQVDLSPFSLFSFHYHLSVLLSI